VTRRCRRPRESRICADAGRCRQGTATPKYAELVIEELSAEEIDAFLRRQVVGRVGCHADGRTYVVPVLYVWDGECVYVQSIEGRKVQMMRANPRVVFEVDEYEAEDGSWRSVIVDGVYEELEGTRAEAALALLVQRFAGRRRRDGAGRTDRKPVAFRIRSTSASGRRVVRTPAMKAMSRAGLFLSRRRAR
jgi:nitroimidazol reductase NimA-like FMN-containing flavoprotein (pyridoxamine 5'-phosphate oxidase superfamily)